MIWNEIKWDEMKRNETKLNDKKWNEMKWNKLKKGKWNKMKNPLISLLFYNINSDDIPVKLVFKKNWQQSLPWQIVCL